MAGKQKRIRVRSKRLDQMDEAKLALALWLMTRELMEETKSSEQPALPDARPSEAKRPEAA